MHNFKCNPQGGTKLVFYIFEPAATLRDRQDAFRIDHIDHRTDMLAFYGFSETFQNFFQFFPEIPVFFFKFGENLKNIPGNMGVKYVQQLFQKRDEEHLEMKDDLNLMLND